MEQIEESKNGFVCCLNSDGKSGCVKISNIDTIKMDPQGPDDNHPLPTPVPGLFIFLGLAMVALSIYLRRK